MVVSITEIRIVTTPQQLRLQLNLASFMSFCNTMHVLPVRLVQVCAKGMMLAAQCGLLTLSARFTFANEGSSPQAACLSAYASMYMT